ncbi:MAG: hypothetical protein ACTSO2_09105 [Promethearchaeota archaeon]
MGGRASGRDWANERIIRLAKSRKCRGIIQNIFFLFYSTSIIIGII